MNEKFGRIIAARELSANEILIVTLFNNYKLDAATGKIIWKEANSTESAQVAQLGALGAFLKEAVENLTKDQEIDLRFYQPPGSDIFYLSPLFTETELTNQVTVTLHIFILEVIQQLTTLANHA